MTADEFLARKRFTAVLDLLDRAATAGPRAEPKPDPSRNTELLARFRAVDAKKAASTD